MHYVDVVQAPCAGRYLGDTIRKMEVKFRLFLRINLVSHTASSGLRTRRGGAICTEMTDDMFVSLAFAYNKNSFLACLWHYSKMTKNQRFNGAD